MRWPAIITLLFACATDETTPCEPGACLEHGFGAVTLEPYQERDGVCLSWTIGNDQALNVNALRATNEGAYHHSNWFWVPETVWDVPDGEWLCSDHDFSELKAAIEGSALFAQSTQTTDETQRFLPGAAVAIPPRSRLMSELFTRLELLSESELTTPLTPFRLNYGDLDIPPESSAVHAAECDLADLYENVTGYPYEMKLHYLLPHFHALGTAFSLEVAGGDRDGELLYEVRDAYGHPLGHTFEEPVDLTGTTGLEFACEHTNPTSETVGFGIGDQEMCVALGFVDGRFRFDSQVGETTTAEIDSDGVAQRRGDCLTLGVAN
jgi:hypothetical protein